MKLLRTVSKLKIVGLIAILPILIAGTVVAYNIATPSKTTNNATQTEQITIPKKIDKQDNDSEQVEAIPEDQTSSESTANTSTQPTTQTPKTTTAQPTQTATDTTPQQTTTITPTCNESMKSSYTSLYSSQVNAENASWTNQINAWNSYAAANGMAFSGYVQDQINQNKPAHDARLAQLQTQYYQNLTSINCNP